MAMDVSEVAMPEGTVERHGLVEELDVRNLLDQVMLLGVLVLEVAHVRGKELDPDPMHSRRSRCIGAGGPFARRDQGGVDRAGALVGYEGLRRQLDVDPPLFGGGSADFI